MGNNSQIFDSHASFLLSGKLPRGVNRRSFTYTGIPPHTDPRACGSQSEREEWLRDRNRAKSEMKRRIRERRDQARLRRKQEQ
jgi:hypothetical protein